MIQPIGEIFCFKEEWSSDISLEILFMIGEIIQLQMTICMIPLTRNVHDKYVYNYGNVLVVDYGRTW